MTGLPVSIVIPTRDRAELVRACASHLQGDPAATQWELVVVDDAPNSRLQLDPFPGFRAVRVLQSGGRGHAAARNVGWRAARGNVVVFLDDDIRPRRGTIGQLSQAVVTGQGDWVSAAVVPSRAGNPYDDVTVPERPLGDDGTVALFATQCVATRPTCLEQVGGFDETLPRQVDTDISYRARAHGHRLTLIPAAIAEDWDPKTALSAQVHRTLISKRLLPRLLAKYRGVLTHEECVGVAYCHAPFYWRCCVRSDGVRFLKHVLSLPGAFGLVYLATRAAEVSRLPVYRPLARMLRGVATYKAFRAGLNELSATERSEVRALLTAGGGAARLREGQK